MRKARLFYLLIIFTLIIISVGFVISKSNKIKQIQYLQSDSFSNDLTSIEFAVNKYERVFYKKPTQKTDFIENIPNWFSEDDPLSHLSDGFSELDLSLAVNDSLYYVNSLLLFNSENSSSRTKYFKSLSLIDAFFFNGIIILDSMPIINEELYIRPPFNVYFVKNGMPVLEPDFTPKFEYSLKLLSLDLMKEFKIKTSQFNRFKYTINGKKEQLNILYDKNGFVNSHPDIKNRLLEFLQSNNKQLLNYDEVYLSLSLFPEIVPKN